MGKIWNEWFTFALAYSGYQTPARLPQIDVPAQMQLSGLLMMADWIASNADDAPLLSYGETGDALHYPQRADAIWERLSLPNPWTPCRIFLDCQGFQQRFGFLPNAVQRQLISAAEASCAPGIYILEAQMGLGKTEAALAAAEVLAGKWGCNGVFFGLPTQATANGIFPRLKRWAQGQSQAVQHSIRLAHGMAMQNETYRELFHGTACQEEDCPYTGLTAHPWLEGRKQALLSSFVVGTVDQLLLAALKQRQVMLRHLGLAGKVVIIDECHAYDAYMNRYLDRALYWLGRYCVPVILLSATLPAKRRSNLIQAYRSGSFLQGPPGWQENQSYPLLTWAEGNTVKQGKIPADSPVKTISVLFREQADIADLLKEKLADGGCAGVIVNTVTQAQLLAQYLQTELPHHTVLLIHARFVMADRVQREEELLRRLGKRSTPAQRDGLIVVGTQILEQSLDLDFDLLVTQLCPMDLLLQRMGRLHRHAGRLRPRRLKKACCVVLNRNLPDDASKQIYGEWLLARTGQILPETVRFPEDISPLVQQTYLEPAQTDPLYPLWQAHQNQQRQRERAAEGFRLAAEPMLFGSLHGLLDGSLGDRDEIGQASVRDGDSALWVLLLVRYRDHSVGFLPWQYAGARVPCDRTPSQEECFQILRQAVQLPRLLSVYRMTACIEQLEKENAATLAAWRHTKWLRGERVLVLEENLQANLCGVHLCYSREYGLIWKKEGESIG